MKTSTAAVANLVCERKVRLYCALALALLFWQFSPGIAQQTSPVLRFTSSLTFQEVAPGIEHGQMTTGHTSNDDRTGPWLINVLRINPRRAQLKVVHALDEGVGLETVSSMAARHQATAATNGGYFRVNGTYRGECVGLLVLNGNLISEPHNDRAEFGLIKNSETTDIIFGHLKFSGEITAGKSRRAIQGVNRPIAADEMLVFTPEFHRTTLTNPEVIEVVVRRGRIAAIHDLTGSSQIPSDGFVISALGKSRTWIKTHLRQGARVNFSWRLKSIEPTQDENWPRAYAILGGGPQLVKQGTVAITNIQERITAPFVNDGHPRTAIAKTRSGHILLVTVDGRMPGESIGMSLNTLAELLIELGAVEGMNLDGGGSTTMVVKNKLVNRPSDATGERPVSDAILAFPKAN